MPKHKAFGSNAELERRILEKFGHCKESLDAAKSEMLAALERAKATYGSREAALAFEAYKARGVIKLMSAEGAPPWIVQLVQGNIAALVAFAGSELDLNAEKTMAAIEFFGELSQIVSAKVEEAAKKGKQG